jgi:hypothetical protein
MESILKSEEECQNGLSISILLMETTFLNKVLQNGSASVKESFSDSDTDVMELHFSYILESEIKAHSVRSQIVLLKF